MAQTTEGGQVKAPSRKPDSTYTPLSEASTIVDSIEASLLVDTPLATDVRCSGGSSGSSAATTNIRLAVLSEAEAQLAAVRLVASVVLVAEVRARYDVEAQLADLQREQRRQEARQMLEDQLKRNGCGGAGNLSHRAPTLFSPSTSDLHVHSARAPITRMRSGPTAMRGPHAAQAWQGAARAAPPPSTRRPPGFAPTTVLTQANVGSISSLRRPAGPEREASSHTNSARSLDRQAAGRQPSCEAAAEQPLSNSASRRAAELRAAELQQWIAGGRRNGTRTGVAAGVAGASVSRTGSADDVGRGAGSASTLNSVGAQNMRPSRPSPAQPSAQRAAPGIVGLRHSAGGMVPGISGGICSARRRLDFGEDPAL